MRRRPRPLRVGGALALAVMAGTLSGCQLLGLLGGDPLAPFPSFDPNEYAYPSPEATFTTGSATLVLADETVTFDRLVSPGTVTPDYGTDVKWTGSDGWYLTFYGSPPIPGYPDDTAYISLDRIFDGRHWVVYNPDRCITTLTESGNDGIAGTATCLGLRWSDYFGAFGAVGAPVFIEGEPAFDAEIEFEAH